MPSTSTHPRLRFGVFECDLDARELRKSGVRIRLQEQPFRILEALIESPGRIVSREELRQRLWPSDVYVDFDRSLNKSIARLRDALSDSADGPRYIETLPRQGYRFLAEVSTAGGANGSGATAAVAGEPAEALIPADVPLRQRSSSHWRLWAIIALVPLAILGTWIATRTPAMRPAERGIVVTPLRNLSGDPSQEYLSDGLTEALVTSLGKLGSVRVISLTTAMQYKQRSATVPQIAKELNVDLVLEGSVSKSGDQIRVALNLIDGRSDQHLWAESFDGDKSGIFVLQSQIGRAVAERVPAIMNLPRSPASESEQRTVTAAAYDEYLRGKYFASRHDKASLLKSIEHYQSAIAAQTDYAEAYAGLANTYVTLSGMYWPPHDAMPKAKAAAERALELKKDLPDVYSALGFIDLMYDWNWAEAERHLTTAIALNPSNAQAHSALAGLFISQGRKDEGVAEALRAVQLDPLSLELSFDVESWFFEARRWDLLDAQAKKDMEIDSSFSLAHAMRGEAMARTHQPNFLREAEIAEKNAEDPFALASIGDVYALAGKRPDAERILARMEAIGRQQYMCRFELAAMQTSLGHTDAAFEELERAYRDHADCMPFLRADIRLDALRGDSRFDSLLERMRLTPKAASTDSSR